MPELDTWMTAPEKEPEMDQWMTEPEEDEEDGWLKRLGKGALSTATGAIDIAYGYPKYGLQILDQTARTALGEQADEARKSAQEDIETHMPSLTSWVDKNFGSDLEKEPSHETMMKPFEWLDKGINWTAESLFDDPEKQGMTKQALDQMFFLGAPGAAKSAGKVVGKSVDAMKATDRPFAPKGPEPTLEPNVFRGRKYSKEYLEQYAKDSAKIEPTLEIPVRTGYGEPKADPVFSNDPLLKMPEIGAQEGGGLRMQEPGRIFDKGERETQQGLQDKGYGRTEPTERSTTEAPEGYDATINGPGDGQLNVWRDEPKAFNPADPYRTRPPVEDVATAKERLAEGLKEKQDRDAYTAPFEERAAAGKHAPRTYKRAERGAGPSGHRWKGNLRKRGPEGLDIEHAGAEGPTSRRLGTDPNKPLELVPREAPGPRDIATQHEQRTTVEQARGGENMPAPFDPVATAQKSTKIKTGQRMVETAKKRSEKAWRAYKDMYLRSLNMRLGAFRQTPANKKKLAELEKKGKEADLQIEEMQKSLEEVTAKVIEHGEKRHRARGIKQQGGAAKMIRDAGEMSLVEEAAMPDVLHSGKRPYKSGFTGEPNTQRYGMQQADPKVTRSGRKLSGFTGNDGMGRYDQSSVSGTPEPSVFNSARGKAPDPNVFRGKDGREAQDIRRKYMKNKQRGAMDVDAYIQSIRKGAKNAKEFADKIAKELGEEYRPFALAMWKTKESDAEKPKKTEQKPSTQAKGIGKALLVDIRTPEEFVAQELAGVKNWKDTGTGGTHLLPGSSIATLNSKNPLVRYIVDNVQKYERWSRTKKEEAKLGIRSTVGQFPWQRRWARHMKTDAGAITTFQRMNRKDVAQAKDVWLNEFAGKDINMTKEALSEHGLNAQQIQATLAARAQLDLIAVKFNELAAETGTQPITFQPNFFPSMWKGDYRVYLKDADGIVQKTFGAETRMQAEKIKASLDATGKEHGLTAELTEAKSKYDINDTSSFTDTLDLLPKDSEAYKAVMSTYNQVITHRGFRKHTLKKKNVGGFLGSDTGPKGVPEFIAGLELYIDRAYNFMGHTMKRRDLKQVLDGFKENGVTLKEQSPNAFRYVNRHIDNSTGALESKMTFIDDALQGASSKMGFGKSGPGKLTSELSGMASAFWLSTLKFGFSQLMQPMYNIPKAIALKSAGWTNKSITKEFFNAYKETFFPTKETSVAMTWAKDHGYIDSKIMELMGVKYDKGAKSLANRLAHKPRDAVSFTLGKLEQEAVRTPAFIFYHNLLKDTIKNPIERRAAAGELTNQYMVNYGRADSPHMFAELGEVGAAVKPLKQFTFAYWAQALEYLQLAKNEKNVKPMVAFLGVQGLIAGANGMLGLAELTAGILILNNTFGLGLPTPQEMMLKGEWPDLPVFGGVSTGMEAISDLVFDRPQSLEMTSLGAPTAAEMGGAPGYSFAWDIVKWMGNLGIKTAMGEAKDEDAMRAWQSVTPNTLQFIVENAYTNEQTGIVPNPNKKMEPSMDRPRTREEREARWLGGKSIHEAREKAVQRGATRQNQEGIKRRGELLDVMVDRLAKREDIPKGMPQKWVALGGQKNTLRPSIIKRMKRRASTWTENHLKSIEGLSGKQRAKRLKDFHSEFLDGKSPDEVLDTLRRLEDDG